MFRIQVPTRSTATSYFLANHLNHVKRYTTASIQCETQKCRSSTTLATILNVLAFFVLSDFFFGLTDGDLQQFFVAQSQVLQECWLKGYNSTILKCTSCSSLSKFNLEILQESCLKCCQFIENEPAIKKYSKARLEICTCKFGSYPQIQAFIKSKLPEQHPNLQIRYVHGRDPIIKLIDEMDEVKEIIAIEKWNTETVDEFLKTHVENDSRDYLLSNLI